MKKNEEIQLANKEPSPPTDLSEALTDAPARHYQKTAGEKIHNEITFRGVDWIANTAFAVGFAYWVNRTAHGQRNFASRSNKLFSTAFKPFTKDAQQLSEWANHGTTFASIVLGGTAIIPPMIVLDRNKRSMVEYFDRKIYGDEAVDTEERFKMRYEEMMRQPEKSFLTGMAARITVLAPMLWGHVKYNDQMNKIMYQPLARGSKSLMKGAGYQPEKLMTRKFHGEKDVTDWEFLHTTFGMDVGLTLIYSFAHEWVYKSYSNLFHSSKNTQHPPPDRLRSDEPSPAPAPMDAPEATLASGKHRMALGQLMQAPKEMSASHG